MNGALNEYNNYVNWENILRNPLSGDITATQIGEGIYITTDASTSTAIRGVTSTSSDFIINDNNPIIMSLNSYEIDWDRIKTFKDFEDLKAIISKVEISINENNEDFDKFKKYLKGFEPEKKKKKFKNDINLINL